MLLAAILADKLEVSCGSIVGQKKAGIATRGDDKTRKTHEPCKTRKTRTHRREEHTEKTRRTYREHTKNTQRTGREHDHNTCKQHTKNA